MQPQILVLREGTDQSQGKPQLISNINACQLVVDAVRTTLGPRGMDKLIVDHNGKAVISNDGATIMKLLDIVHPAAKTLVDIAKSQDAEVGDGTTSVVILAGELLKRLKPFIEEGVHPRIIVRAVRNAGRLAVDKVKELAVKIDSKSPQEQRELLRKCASTAMASKLIHQQKDHFSKMVVDAVLSLDAPLLPLDMIGIKKVTGGALEDSFLVAGVAFKKTFSYAGFEMQPKNYENCKIALLNIELELKAERDNAEVRVDNVKEYQKVVDAEWQILYDKLAALHASGASVVLSKLPIGDVATQYFADRDMFCAGRVTEEDLRRTQRACGGAVLSSVRDLKPEVLGQCAEFSERQVGGERYNIFTGCPAAKTCTLILRGGAEQFLEETERSLHDAIMIVRRTIKNDAVVAGGGAIDMELSKHLRDHSKTIAGKEQLLVAAGFDATSLLNKLRQKHHQGEVWYGVGIQKEDIADNFAACVWEPAVVKISAITAACEAAAQVGPYYGGQQMFEPAGDVAAQGTLAPGSWKPGPNSYDDYGRDYNSRDYNRGGEERRAEPWRLPYGISKEQQAAILHHKQSLSSEGAFRFEYASDNGLAAGEVIEPDGSRVGAYQYKDPSGQLVKLKYRAGKEGFQILEGSHLPKSPEPVAPQPQTDSYYTTAYEQQRRQYELQQQYNQQRAEPQQWQQESQAAGGGGGGAGRQYYNNNWAPDGRDDGQYRDNDIEASRGPHSFGEGYAFAFKG